jgi:Protein of unknown function (DUF2975)
MRKNVLTLISVFLISIALFLVLIFILAQPIAVSHSSSGGFSYKIPAAEEDTLSLRENFNDTLPHYLYKEYKNFFDRMNYDLEQNQNVTAGSGISVGNTGVYELKQPLEFPSNEEQNLLRTKDSVFFRKELELIKKFKNKIPKKDQYFISFKEFQLKIGDELTRFYVDSQFNYKQISVVDSVSEGNKFGHLELKKINFRYSEKDKKVFFPITKKNFTLLTKLLNYSFALKATLGFAFFLYFPIRILINISKGNAFCENNIKYLRLIFLVTTILLLSGYAFEKIIQVIVLKKTDDTFVAPHIVNEFIELVKLTLYILATYLVYKAFKKGSELQQEQELTV